MADVNMYVPRTNREVKEAYVLAERMKNGPFDPEGWSAKFAIEAR